MEAVFDGHPDDARTRKKKMNMIRHYFKVQYFKVMFFC